MPRIYLRFPEGKKLAVTLSYDDGVVQDRRLIEILQKNGMKGTFNVNTGMYSMYYPRLSREDAISLYKNSGMEVAVHSVNHPYLAMIPTNLCTQEILLDRRNLEEDFECLIRGLAYPNNSYNDNVVNVLKQCGIVYGRTTDSTHSYLLPEDWHRWHPTCHHNDPELMELARNFIEGETYGKPSIFYLWGHSYEFDDHNNWEVIEAFAEYVGNRDNVWYATNIEIYDYVAAYEQLLFSLDEKHVYNPTNRNVYFQIDDKHYCIKPGENLLD